ncbi:MAG: ABC transporter permease [Clostridiales bacterium]
MIKYILNRIVLSFLTLLIILSVLFMLLEFMPGSPFNDEKLKIEQKELLYKKYGLDKPIHERFVIYLKNVVVKGDFGVSYAIEKNVPVTKILKDRMPISIRLGIQALIFGTLIGIILAFISAIYKNTIWDSITTVIAIVGISIPSFVFAIGLSYYLGYKLPKLLHFSLFPLTYDIDNVFKSSILPTIALSMFVIATVARFMRTELVEVLGSEYILLAEAKGLNSKKVIFRHAFRNAVIPVITVLGPLTVGLMTGSLVIERIFTIPGIGDLLVTAISVNDFNIVIAISFFYSMFYIAVVLIVDILYGLIDPRIRIAKGEQ